MIIGFTPSAAGARSANLVITHNAAGAQSSTALSGTGVALSPVIGVSPTTLSFSQTIAASFSGVGLSPTIRRRSSSSQNFQAPHLSRAKSFFDAL